MKTSTLNIEHRTSNIEHRTRPLRSRLNRAGFTLVEMLLVLVILAVLAAIVIPKFSGRSQQAKETAAKSQISRHRTRARCFRGGHRLLSRKATQRPERARRPAEQCAELERVRI